MEDIGAYLFAMFTVLLSVSVLIARPGAPLNGKKGIAVQPGSLRDLWILRLGYEWL